MMGEKTLKLKSLEINTVYTVHGNRFDHWLSRDSALFSIEGSDLHYAQVEDGNIIINKGGRLYEKET